MGPDMLASSYWGHIGGMAISHPGGMCQSYVYVVWSEVSRYHVQIKCVTYQVVCGHRCLLASSSALHLLDTELHPLLPGPTNCQRSQEASRERLLWLPRQGQRCLLRMVVGIWVGVASRQKTIPRQTLWRTLAYKRGWGTVPASGTGMRSWSLLRGSVQSLEVKLENQGPPLAYLCW